MASMYGCFSMILFELEPGLPESHLIVDFLVTGDGAVQLVGKVRDLVFALLKSLLQHLHRILPSTAPFLRLVLMVEERVDEVLQFPMGPEP